MSTKIQQYNSISAGPLDLFIKTTRGTPVDHQHKLMARAWAADPLIAIRIVFYLRDRISGKGIRGAFYTCLDWLITNGHGSHVLKNLEQIPVFGTHKDLFACVDTDLEEPMLCYYAKVLCDDIDLLNERPDAAISLAGKWAPTEGGALDKKYHLAKKLMRALHEQKPSLVTNLKDYRVCVIGPLRARAEIVERHMCGANWNGVNFEQVPMAAMKRYHSAFAKHLNARYNEFLKNSKRRNGNTLDSISVESMLQLFIKRLHACAYNNTIESQWREIIRKYGCVTSSLPIIDANVTGKPIEYARALGILVSETASESLRGSVLNFSEKPNIFKLNVNTFQEKISIVSSLPWSDNINIAHALEVVLAAKRVPDTVYIFTDKSLDKAYPGDHTLDFQHLEQLYAQSGYTLPTIVFWNLCHGKEEITTAKNIPNCVLVNGISRSLLRMFLTGRIDSPYDALLTVLNSSRLMRVSLADD